MPSKNWQDYETTSCPSWTATATDPGQHGYFHAGATSSIADSAGGYAAFTLFPPDTSVLTVEFKINLLAPAEGDHLEAVGTVINPGRTLTICRLEVFGVTTDHRTLVAAGQQTLIRIDSRPER